MRHSKRQSRRYPRRAAWHSRISWLAQASSVEVHLPRISVAPSTAICWMTQSISHITAEAMTAESTIDRSLRTIIERDFHRPELSLSTYSITQVKDNTCIVYNIHTQKKKKPSYFNWKTFTNVLVLRQSDVVARNFVTVTRIDVDLVEVMMCPQGYFIYVITRMRETTFKSEKKQHVHTLG